MTGTQMESRLIALEGLLKELREDAAHLAELENRLQTLESELARLREQQRYLATCLPQPPEKPSEPWWITDAGRFSNDPEFLEMVRLGREYRRSLHPDYKKKSKNSKGKKK